MNILDDYLFYSIKLRAQNQAESERLLQVLVVTDPLLQPQHPVASLLNFYLIYLNQAMITQNNLLIFLHFSLKLMNTPPPPQRAGRFITSSRLNAK